MPSKRKTEVGPRPLPPGYALMAPEVSLRVRRNSRIFVGAEIVISEVGSISVYDQGVRFALQPQDFEWLHLSGLLEQAARAGCGPLAQNARLLDWQPPRLRAAPDPEAGAGD